MNTTLRSIAVILRGVSLSLGIMYVSLASGVEDEEWVTGYGEVLVSGMSSEEAMQKAELIAQQDALAQRGIYIQDFLTILEATHFKGTQVEQFTQTRSVGRIVDSKDPERGYKTMDTGNPVAPSIPVAWVRQEFKIALEHGKPDPNFHVDMSLSRRTYQDGDPVEIRVKANQDCYLTILDNAADGRAYVLLPNGFRKDTYVKRNQEFVLPNDQERKAGISLKVKLPPGQNRATEIVWLFATKERPQIIPEPSRIGSLVSFSKAEAAKLFGQWLVRIPLDQREETFAAYTITQ